MDSLIELIDLDIYRITVANIDISNSLIETIYQHDTIIIKHRDGIHRGVGLNIFERLNGRLYLNKFQVVLVHTTVVYISFYIKVIGEPLELTDSYFHSIPEELNVEILSKTDKLSLISFMKTYKLSDNIYKNLFYHTNTLDMKIITQINLEYHFDWKILYLIYSNYFDVLIPNYSPLESDGLIHNEIFDKYLCFNINPELYLEIIKVYPTKKELTLFGLNIDDYYKYYENTWINIYDGFFSLNFKGTTFNLLLSMESLPVVIDMYRICDLLYEIDKLEDIDREYITESLRGDIRNSADSEPMRPLDASFSPGGFMTHSSVAARSNLLGAKLNVRRTIKWFYNHNFFGQGVYLFDSIHDFELFKWYFGYPDPVDPGVMSTRIPILDKDFYFMLGEIKDDLEYTLNKEDLLAIDEYTKLQKENLDNILKFLREIDPEWETNMQFFEVCQYK